MSLSAPGHGAAFTVELDLPTVSGDVKPWIEPASNIADTTIVLAFEQLIERRAMAAMLREYGATVIEVENSDAVASDEPLATGGRPVDTFVVSATEDPASAGHALALIRQQTGTSDVSSVVLASPADRDRLAEFRAVGFGRHLVRPVRPKSLFEQLTNEAGPSPETDLNEALVGRANHGQDSSDAGQEIRVLLAEDNDINALLAEAMLGKCGYSATRVRNGQAAVDLACAAMEANEPFNVILMDLHMPELDGIAATRKIRERHAERGGVAPAIIAVTANAFPEDRDECLAAGMDDHLAKPFDRSDLAEMIDRYC